MILKYGNYSHADNEANATITREGLEADDGFIYGYKETWSIEGILHGDDNASLVTAMSELITAYSLQDKDLTWTKGSDEMHSLKNADTLTGIKVTNLPHFPKSSSGELTTFRTYNITVEAEVAFTSIDLDADPFVPLILKYEETLDYTGTGGPKFGLLPTLKGKYQKQLLTETSPVTLIQSGISVGLGGYPDPPSPLWIKDEHVDRRQITRAPTRRRGGKNLEYPIHWSYHFERNDQFPTPKK